MSFPGIEIKEERQNNKMIKEKHKSKLKTKMETKLKTKGKHKLWLSWAKLKLS